MGEANEPRPGETPTAMYRRLAEEKEQRRIKAEEYRKYRQDAGVTEETFEQELDEQIKEMAEEKTFEVNRNWALLRCLVMGPPLERDYDKERYLRWMEERILPELMPRLQGFREVVIRQLEEMMVHRKSALFRPDTVIYEPRTKEE